MYKGKGEGRKSGGGSVCKGANKLERERIYSKAKYRAQHRREGKKKACREGHTRRCWPVGGKMNTENMMRVTREQT